MKKITFTKNLKKESVGNGMKSFTVNKTKKIILMLSLLLCISLLAGCKSSTADDTYGADAASSDVVAVTSDESDESAETAETTEETQTDAVEDVVESDTSVDAGASVYPFEFVDKFGNTITIQQEPMAIVSFSPEITETLFALGEGPQVIGRSSYCDYPSEVAQVKDMGSLFDFSLETVLEVKPDLVFLSSMVSEDIYKSLVDNGIAVAVFDTDQTLQSTKSLIETIGNIVNKKSEALQVTNSIQAALDDIATRAKDREKKSVYYAVSVGEYTSAATGDTFIGDIINAIGATNAAADGTDWMYTVEQLVEKNPDFVICSQLWDTKATILTLDGYKDLTAVKEGRLMEVDENIFSRQGPRVVDALYTLETIIYGK